MNADPANPNYNTALRDAVMDQAPFYDPNHKCGIVRENVFKDCLKELRLREIGRASCRERVCYAV